MLYKKEKLLVTSNFSFSHSYFQKTFSADSCGLFEKEFNGPEKETLKNMSKARLFAHDCIWIKNKYSSFKLKGYAGTCRLKSLKIFQ